MAEHLIEVAPYGVCDCDPRDFPISAIEDGWLITDPGQPEVRETGKPALYLFAKCPNHPNMTRTVVVRRT